MAAPPKPVVLKVASRLVTFIAIPPFQTAPAPVPTEYAVVFAVLQMPHVIDGIVNVFVAVWLFTQ